MSIFSKNNNFKVSTAAESLSRPAPVFNGFSESSSVDLANNSTISIHAPFSSFLDKISGHQIKAYSILDDNYSSGQFNHRGVEQEFNQHVFSAYNNDNIWDSRELFTDNARANLSGRLDANMKANSSVKDYQEDQGNVYRKSERNNSRLETQRDNIFPRSPNRNRIDTLDSTGSFMGQSNTFRGSFTSFRSRNADSQIPSEGVTSDSAFNSKRNSFEERIAKKIIPVPRVGSSSGTPYVGRANVASRRDINKSAQDNTAYKSSPTFLKKLKRDAAYSPPSDSRAGFTTYNATQGTDFMENVANKQRLMPMQHNYASDNNPYNDSSTKFSPYMDNIKVNKPTISVKPINIQSTKSNPKELPSKGSEINQVSSQKLNNLQNQEIQPGNVNDVTKIHKPKIVSGIDTKFTPESVATLHTKSMAVNNAREDKRTAITWPVPGDKQPATEAGNVDAIKEQLKVLEQKYSTILERYDQLASNINEIKQVSAFKASSKYSEIAEAIKVCNEKLASLAENSSKAMADNNVSLLKENIEEISNTITQINSVNSFKLEGVSYLINQINEKLQSFNNQPLDSSTEEFINKASKITELLEDGFVNLEKRLTDSLEKVHADILECIRSQTKDLSVNQAGMNANNRAEAKRLYKAITTKLDNRINSVNTEDIKRLGQNIKTLLDSPLVDGQGDKNIGNVPSNTVLPTIQNLTAKVEEFLKQHKAVKNQKVEDANLRSLEELTDKVNSLLAKQNQNSEIIEKLNVYVATFTQTNDKHDKEESSITSAEISKLADEISSINTKNTDFVKEQSSVTAKMYSDMQNIKQTINELVNRVNVTDVSKTPASQTVVDISPSYVNKAADKQEKANTVATDRADILKEAVVSNHGGPSAKSETKAKVASTVPPLHVANAIEKLKEALDLDTPEFKHVTKDHDKITVDDHRTIDEIMEEKLQAEDEKKLKTPHVAFSTPAVVKTSGIPEASTSLITPSITGEEALRQNKSITQTDKSTSQNLELTNKVNVNTNVSKATTIVDYSKLFKK